MKVEDARVDKTCVPTRDRKLIKATFSPRVHWSRDTWNSGGGQKNSGVVTVLGMWAEELETIAMKHIRAECY